MSQAAFEYIDNILIRSSIIGQTVNILLDDGCSTRGKVMYNGDFDVRIVW